MPLPFKLNLSRRAFLRSPLGAMLFYAVSGVLGLSARAGAKRVWRINASSFAGGIEKFFNLVRASAADGKSFPVSALMWYFPLNPTTPDGFLRLVARGAVTFGPTLAVSAHKYDSLDFMDAVIGNITTILPEKVVAKYIATAESVTFNLEGSLPQVVIWKIPKELGMPKSLRVNSLTFRADGTEIQFSNTVNSDILEIQLFINPPGGPWVALASAEPLIPTQALLLLAQNTTVCCNGNCYRDDGAVGGDKELSKRWSIVKRMVPPDSGACSLRETDKDSPPLSMDYSEIAGGFLSMEAASEAMKTTYKEKCPPPPQPTAAGS